MPIAIDNPKENQMTRAITLALMTLMIMGCESTTTHTQYYQLADEPATATVQEGTKRVVIEPVSLVDFLKRPNILLKQENNTLYVTNYHVWAEPLDKAIARAMVNRINQRGSELRAGQARFSQCLDSQCVSLKLIVEGFYPTDQSSVIFSGKYQLKQGTHLLSQQDFSLAKDLASDGYPHAVEQLKQLVYQLSSQIEQEVTAKLVDK